jgi:phosphoglycerate dehydrogenase-like enzyme
MKVLYLGRRSDETDPWAGEFFKALAGRYPVEFFDPAQPLPQQFAGVEVVLDPGGAWNTPERIAAAKVAGVKLWQVTTNGLDKVHVASFFEHGLPLAHAPGPLSAVALAEHALMFILCLAKNLALNQRDMRSAMPNPVINDELSGKVLGNIGLGASGRELAIRAKALGMRVMAIDIAGVSETVRQELGLELFGDLSQFETVLRQADYISLHTPLTPQTRHMLNRDTLGLMKPTAALINIARGPLIDEAALLEALQNGRLRGAGLDVFEVEPVPPDHPLLHLPNVITTPHKAGVTFETARLRGQAAAENVVRVAEGKSPYYLVVTEQ